MVFVKKNKKGKANLVQLREAVARDDPGEVN